MSLYKEFSALFPYLQSVRKIKNFLSFDVSFPKTWKLPKRYVEEDKVMEQQSTNIEERLFSFVSEINEIEIEKCSTNILHIISYNREREDKERLFNEKVEELKQVFEKQSLKNLQALKFDIKSKKIELEDDEEEIKTTGVVDK
jgi:cysteinyl-tRNA synthetase